MNTFTTFLATTRRALPLLVLPLLPFAVHAQSVTGYTTRQVSSTSAATYNALKPVTTTPATRTAGDENDGYYNLLPIGFTFNFAGTNYTTFSASTNGWMTFGQALTDSAPANDLTASTVRPVVAPLWDDLSFGTATGNATSDGNLFYETTGTAGSRVCTIEWRNMRWSPVATGSVVSAMVRLTEGTNTIDFVYFGGPAGASGTRSGSMGFAGIPTGDFLSGAGLGSNTTFSTTTEATNITGKPTSGRQIVFTPLALASRSAEALAPFQLAPNPATNEVRIIGNDSKLPVQLFDNLGKLVRTQTTATADVLNLHGLASGLYLVRVGPNSRRLVVE